MVDPFATTWVVALDEINDKVRQQVIYYLHALLQEYPDWLMEKGVGRGSATGPYLQGGKRLVEFAMERMKTTGSERG